MKKILVYIACNFIILVIAVAVIGAASRDHSEMPEHLKGSYIDISGLRIRYVQKGKGRDVLFIHGSPGSIEDWSPLAEDLSSQFRLTCYDRPGQGFSGTPNESFHLENNARIAFRLIEKLGLIDPIVVGHSYGGSTVLAMAVAGPANVGPFVTIGARAYQKENISPVYQLVTIPLLGRGVAAVSVPFFGYGMIKKGIIDGFYPDQDTIPDGFIKTRYQIWSRTKVFVSMAREELNLNQDLKRLADHYRNINSRMVIIHGSEDRIVPVQNARKLHEAINNSVLHVFPGIGHYVQFASPAEVKEILLNL